MTAVPNVYLSQIEPGAIGAFDAGAEASRRSTFSLLAEALFAQAGSMPESTPPDDNATETTQPTKSGVEG